jgi:hypothetical protein
MFYLTALSRRKMLPIAPRAVTMAGLILLISILSVPSLAGEFERVKRAGEYEIGIWLDRSPVVGDNFLSIRLRNGEGKTVDDASIMVNYYMPPMPRMAPMNYRTNAVQRGGIYGTRMHFIMEGPWVIAIKINRSGRMITAKFNLDVH